MTYPFIPCRKFTRANRTAIDLIVLHSAECSEVTGAARAVAEWGAGPNGPKASWHYVVDDTEVIQCVLEKDVAYHAAGANDRSIGIEHAGRAKQTEEQWCDLYSTVMLERSAELVAELCRRYDIPIVRLGPTELRAGQRGICGHVDVSKAYGRSTHWDPGQGFPYASYLATVQRAFDLLETTARQSSADDSARGGSDEP